MTSCFCGPRHALILLAVFLGALLPLSAQTVALAPFLYADEERNDPDISSANLDLLLLQLSSNARYKWVERAEIDRIMAEQALTNEGFTHADSAARLGRLLRVDVILTGTFINPADKPAFVLIEAVEANRAEVVARAEVPLSSAFQQDAAARLTSDDVAAINRAAGPLLAKAFAVIHSRPQQVLLKLLALPNLTGNPVYKRFGERLEAELARRAAATPNQCLLRTDRPDAATDESELRLLGLVETDSTMWEQFADHYVWGACDTMDGLPILRLLAWDGRSERRELIIPLPENPNALDTVINAACDSILAATTRATRLTPTETFADQQRAAVADMLLDFAHQLDGSRADSYDQRGARRLVVSAIFLNPAKPDGWLQLDRQRWQSWRENPMQAIADQITYRLRLRSRFIVDAQGKIHPEALFDENEGGLGCLRSLYAQMIGQGVVSGESLTRTEVPRLQKLWDRVVADVLAETAHAAERLANAAPGQEVEFRKAAKWILVDTFQPSIPRWLYRPDPVHTERIVRLLAPRLKIGEALCDAWGGGNFQSQAIDFFDEREAVTECLGRQGRFGEADRFSLLNPDELAQALAAGPPADSNAGEIRENIAGWTERGDKANAAYDQRNFDILRLRAEACLKACSTEAPNSKEAIAALLAAPLLRGDRFRGDRSGGEGKPYAGGMPSMAGYDAVEAQSFPNLEKILGQATPDKWEGIAFVMAIRERRWLVVDYLLQLGMIARAPSWPASDNSTWPYSDDYFRRSDKIGAFALAEAVARNRLDLADRLIKAGVRFDPNGDLGNAAIERALRRRSKEGLQRLLDAGALGVSLKRDFGKQQTSSPCLAAAVDVRDMELLQMLLAAGANVSDSIVDYGQSYGMGGGVFGGMENRFRNAITYAGWTGWSQGVEAMLKAPTFAGYAVYNANLGFEDWPHQFASDPETRGLLLRASLRAMFPAATPDQAAGIELFSSISANHADGVASAWRTADARDFRVAGYSALTFACLEKRPEIARWLLLSGAPVDEADADGTTALGYAAAAGEVKLVRLLASKGADVNSGGVNHMTPLLHAIRAGDEDMALTLTALHASVCPARKSAEDDPLFEAVKYNMVPVVDRLLAAGANPFATYDGEANILFAAARSNNPELIERFVRAGCNLAARDRSGGTPLKTAVVFGAPQSTAKLLALGLRDPEASKYAADIVRYGWIVGYTADIPSRPRHYQPDASQCVALMDKYGQLPAGAYRSALRTEFGSWQSRFLAYFAEKSPAEIQAFVAGGGSLDAYVGDNGVLPLYDAVGRGDFEQVKTLLALDAPTEEPPGADSHGRYLPNTNTPLMFPAGLNEPLKYEMLKLLFAHGERADAVPKGNNPSILALALSSFPQWKSSPATVRLLLDHGAVIDSSATKAYADLVAHDPKLVLRIEAVLSPEEIRLLRGGK
jgi:ankyrin repeat protein